MVIRGVSRRRFIKRALSGSASLLGFEPLMAAERVLGKSDGSTADALQPAETLREIQGIAAPQFAQLTELPLSNIQPRGWLKRYLETQRDGLTGHLDETGGFPFNTYGWAGPGISNIPRDPFAYEQAGYWVDGMIRCGYLLEDRVLIDKARQQTKYVLDHSDEDGYLGPKYLKNKTRWPHVVFFRALFAEGSATGNPQISEAIKRHFLSSPYPHRGYREACAIEAMMWAYGRDRDPGLLRLSEDVYREFEASIDINGVSPAMFSDGRPSRAHGVTYNEMAKLGAILYLHTGIDKYLDVSVAAYKKLDDFHMLVDGVNSSTEVTREVTPLESHETCDISDYTWSVGYLLMATGRAEYADKIERACFNAAPGAVSEDFTSLQYFSCPNQVIAGHNTNHNVYFHGDRTMAFGTAHIAACCSGNVNRAMPNYASRLWMRDRENGLVAALYAPSTVTCRVGPRMQEVTITEETHYPFSDQILFVMTMKEETEFAFSVRIPSWCRQARILVNSRPIEDVLPPGSFVKIGRKFRDGDKVLVELPQEVRATEWPNDGIAIERGPLVYSLRIDEEWESLEQVARAADGVIGMYNLLARYPGLVAHNVYPRSPWNYALDVDTANASEKVQVIQSEVLEERPWRLKEPGIVLRVPARRLMGWDLDRRKEVILEGDSGDPALILSDKNHGNGCATRKGEFVFTPQLPSRGFPGLRLADNAETVTLVPYGCAKLRLTIFPKVVAGERASVSNSYRTQSKDGVAAGESDNCQP